MQQPNPYDPSNVAVAESWSRRCRWRRGLAASGLLLLAIACLLFYTAESITVYTPYSNTTLWSTSSLDDRYYTVTTPIQLMIAIGCAAIGAMLLIAARILRVLRPAFRGHIVE
jgi:hypothetical protein